MTPEQFNADVLSYDGPLPDLNPCWTIAMEPQELAALASAAVLRIALVCDNLGFLKRVAVARTVPAWDVSFFAPNLFVMGREDGQTAATPRPATFYYVKGDVYVEVEGRVHMTWCPLRQQGLVIPRVLLDKAVHTTMNDIVQLIDVAPLTAVHMCVSVDFVQGARLVVGSLGMSRGAGRRVYWALGDPSYTRLEQFVNDCHVWCETSDGAVFDVYGMLLEALGKTAGVKLVHPASPVVLRGHKRHDLVNIGLFYKPAPEHMQVELLNIQLERCAEKVPGLPTPRATVVERRMRVDLSKL